MPRNYARPYEIIDYDQATRLASQARGLGCHYVACAAAAISGKDRDATAIFFDPTPAELDHIAMALEEYLREDASGEEQSAEQIMADYKAWLTA